MKPKPDQRRQKTNFRSRSPNKAPQTLHLYGIHTVNAALANPLRKPVRLLATRNALSRLDLQSSVHSGLKIEEWEPRMLDRLVGRDAVHQGAVLETAYLPQVDTDEFFEGDLILVLDQITDPHNVGAILRSAVALGASTVISTTRHSASETGVLAKSASGALDMIKWMEVRNLSNTLGDLADQGYWTIGLDSEGPAPLEESLQGGRIALVMGAEGKGLRQKTRETCSTLARLDMPGQIKSLNVSNAAALSMYVARRYLATND